MRRPRNNGSHGVDMNVQLTRLTSPIQDELDRVERTIAASLRTDNLFIRQMVDYLARGNGKRLRPTLALLSPRPSETLPTP